MKNFHGVLAGNVHECSLKLSIGRVRNFFLFAALFFSKNLLNLALLPKILLAFGLYCLAAGGVYLLNAWCELTTDDYTEGAHSL